jgi:hypothetical protein
MGSRFNAAFDMAKTAIPKWQEGLGWNESASRRIRLITGLIGLALLFAGIVMQWYKSCFTYNLKAFWSQFTFFVTNIPRNLGGLEIILLMFL